MTTHFARQPFYQTRPTSLICIKEELGDLGTPGSTLRSPRRGKRAKHNYRNPPHSINGTAGGSNKTSCSMRKHPSSEALRRPPLGHRRGQQDVLLFGDLANRILLGTLGSDPPTAGRPACVGALAREEPFSALSPGGAAVRLQRRAALRIKSM